MNGLDTVYWRMKEPCENWQRVGMGVDVTCCYPSVMLNKARRTWYTVTIIDADSDT